MHSMECIIINNSDLKKAQLLQLDIALEIKRLCESNNISYFLIAGSCLGAVRHQGFIPWDDDMDIGMLRSEYERFLHVCSSSLDNRFFLQNWNTDKYFGLPFTKIRLQGTHYIERNAAYVQAHNGIYVDIFPFDNVPKEYKLQNRQKKQSYMLKRFILIKNGYRSWQKGINIKRIAYTVAKIMLLPISTKFLQGKLNEVMMKYNNIPTEKVVAFGGSYGYQKESIYKSWIINTINQPFENYLFPVPKFFYDYLKYFYGEFMKLPPEDKRGDRHNIIDTDFGEYI